MQPAPSDAAPSGDNLRIVKNTLFLVTAQVITTPLSVVVSAVMARYIGPGGYGQLYLASTFCAFGFLAVEWGQSFTLSRTVAQERGQSGVLLGTALLWRVVMTVLVAIALSGGSLAFGYGKEFVTLLLLVVLGLAIGAFTGAFQETVRGFERTDIMAYSQVGSQIVGGAASIATVMLGGGLHALLLAQAATSAVVMLFVMRAAKQVGVGKLQTSAPVLRNFISSGIPFVLFGVAMALQPNVDALFMSKMLPDEVVGWHAVARRLIGFLVFPATALLVALYPTLCRLYAEDQAQYARTSNDAIRTTAVLSVPLALGCFLYPEIGIRIFSEQSYGPAEDNLRIMAGFLFLLYFSMPLGCALLAGGKQKQWSLTQGICVAFSFALNPLLIPWFQQRYGNGGLGVSISSLVSEVFMVAIGIWLAPKGIFDRRMLRQLGLAFLAGAAMFAFARIFGLLTPLLGFVTPYISAPISVVVYGTCLWMVGGIDREQVATLKGMLGRKLAKFRGR